MMSKSEFLQIAPTYYALAIAAYFKDVQQTAYRYEINNYYSDPESWFEGEYDPEYFYLSNQDLFDEAMRWLRDHKAIEILAEPP